MLTLPHYLIQEELHRGQHSLIFRAHGEREGRPVVIKALANPYPPPADVAALEREYEIARTVDAETVLAHLALVPTRNACALVLEDFGGRSLAELLAANGSFEIATFLELAQAITHALGEVHARGIIHKDITPANILYNPRTRQVKLCDFGMASFLRQEKQDFRNARLITGTLAYISPEQTGRMNRAIDYRTDFYSLGATFFHMLAGVPPFTGTDPLELLHCHIAKTAQPPAERAGAVPGQLWAIIRKLMSKNAEDRYQSASGLEHDLAQCARQLREQGTLSAFPPGQEDRSHVFRISEKLYGREAQVATLLETFERVSTGRCELVLVGGYSGVGKSVLVREVHKPISARRGYFISGKCDYLNQHTPLDPVVQALKELVRQLLTEPEELLARWRERLLASLDGQGQLLIDLIPELALIIGAQPSVMALPPVEGQERFESLLQRFLLVFAKQEHPLVLFIDDLQWMDAASLRLLSQIATSPNARHLLILGAYRDNEVTPAHPLHLTLRKIQEEGVPLTLLQLTPLGPEDISRLLEDTLRCDSQSVASLAEPIFTRTGGNPFFVTQLLHALHDEGVLQFNPKARRWTWDTARLQTLGVSENVVDLMVAKIKRYPESTQELLRLASCMGGTFDLNTLAIISQRSPHEVATGLWDAVKDGLVLPLDNAYHYYQWSRQDHADAPPAEEARYRFAHDRIQEAAHSQIPEDQRARVSLRIGRLLLEKTPAEQQMERIFDLVGHLNLGDALITSPEEKVMLAELNLLAGRKAKASTAHQAAIRYLRHGIAMLPDTGWDTHYALMFPLQRELIECEFLTGNLQEAERIFATVSKKARTRQDIGDVYQLMIRICHTIGTQANGLRLGQECLRLFDVDLPNEPERAQAVMEQETAEIERLLAGRDILSLVDAPMMHNRDVAICLGLLHETWTCGVMSGNFTQITLTALKMVSLSLTHGHSEFSSCGYVAYAMVLSIMGNTPRAYAFGTLAMRLNERFANPFVIPKVNNTFANFVNHYSNHIASNIPVYQESFRRCLESGDRWWGSWAGGWIRSAQFIKGDPLSQVLDTCELYRNYIRTSGYVPLFHMLELDEHVALCLQGKTKSRTSFDHAEFSEERLVRNFTEQGFEFGLYWYWLMKALVHYLHGEHARALECTREAARRKDVIAFLMTYPDFFFYDALILAANHDSASEEERRAFVQTLSAHLERLRSWEAHCPDNFRHRRLLVAAELARISGDSAEAQELYEQAIEAAHRSKYVHHEALANELAARHYLSLKRTRAARGYLVEARYLYSRWGAQAKVAQLSATHPESLAPQNALEAAGDAKAARSRAGDSTKVESETLDLATVMKAAQTLSSEIVLDKLLERMMRIGMENAGAQRGVLCLERDGRLLIEASASVDREDITVRQSIPVEQAADLPLSIIKYVYRTGEPLILDDAASDSRFRNDPYIAAEQLRSVLCLPTVRQAGQLGILYLENNRVKGAFPLERTRILQVLSTQAAISLENATLYSTLEQRVQERTAELARSNAELAQTLRWLKDTQQQLVFHEKLASLGTVTAGIAHEIKNPLNFINNFAQVSVELLEELRSEIQAQMARPAAGNVQSVEDLLSDLQHNMKKIHQHGHRADSIVRAMLDHARSSSGDKRSVDINALVAEYVGLGYQGMRSQDPSLTVVLEASYDAAMKPTELVPQELGRVILNLVSNGCYAANEKKSRLGAPFTPTLRVSTRELGTQFEIRIWDNGTGIPESIRDKLFTPFFTTKPPGVGTGLGLSISHQIIKALGGTLCYESEEGQFTEVIITLPREQERSQAA